MKTVTKEINIYKFEELTKEVKEKVIEKYYNEIGYQDNSDFFEEFANELLTLLGFESSKINYSLSYNQGDGVSFDFNLNFTEVIDNINLYKNKEIKEKGFVFLENIINELHDIVKDFEIKNDLLKRYDFNIYTSKNHFSTHYCHVNTRDICIDIDNSINPKEKTIKYFNSLYKIFKEIYYLICDTLENEGYKDIYYTMNDEEFSELSESNNWEYLEDGTMY
jgi:hypothetical protein